MDENWDEFVNFVQSQGLSRDDAYQAINFYQLHMALFKNLATLNAVKYNHETRSIEFGFVGEPINGRPSEREQNLFI